MIIDFKITFEYGVLILEIVFNSCLVFVILPLNVSNVVNCFESGMFNVNALVSSGVVDSKI